MKYFYFLIIFVLSFNLTLAQDSSKTNDKELKHGLEFQIGNLLTLTNFNNYTFSYRYCLNNKSGIRIGLLTNINNDDYDVTQKLDSISNSPQEYNHNYNLKISIQYLYSVMNYNKFSLIFGGGPFISYSKRDYKSASLYSSYTVKYEDNNKTTSYGLDIILGTEYKLSENVILSGEYGLTISKANSDIESFQNYNYTDGSPNYIRSESGQIDSFTTRGLGVNLGLSIFF